MAAQQQEAEANIKRAKQRHTQLQGQRAKLLEAHYAGAIPQDLLATEMHRLTRELAHAEHEIKAANTTMGDVQTTLNDALRAAASCQAEYQQAPPHIRRQINQGFFKKLLIGEDGGVEQYELTEPFAALLTDGRTLTLASEEPDTAATSHVTPDTKTTGQTAEVTVERSRPSRVLLATFPNGDDTTSDETRSRSDVAEQEDHLFGHGLNKRYVVEVAGIEPASSGI